MQVYIVGGAVRDQILNRPIKDKDYVVVGATPKQMLDAGFTQVGADFPVFLHPKTKAEYALARTERKSGTGYKGFSVYAAPDITLEQDLKRRDLTINAMAIEVQGLHDDTPLTGEVIDPYGGKDDVKNRVLRHVSEAFSEDPLRVLRIARFYGRFYEEGSQSNFHIAPETVALIQSINESGELSHLTPERIWTETKRAIMQNSPHAYFNCLNEIGALAYLFPTLNKELSSSFKKEFVFKALALSGEYQLPLENRWALLQLAYIPESYLKLFNMNESDLSTILDNKLDIIEDVKHWVDSIKNLGQSLTAPKTIHQFATSFATTFYTLAGIDKSSAESIADLITLTKANKDKSLLYELIKTFFITKTVYLNCKMDGYIDAYKQVGMQDIDSNLKGAEIGEALNDARVGAVDSLMSENSRIIMF